MTVAITTPNKVYNYTGAGGYTFDFRIFSSSDLDLYHTGTDGTVTNLVLTTDYTVVIDGENGGTVTTINPAATGGTLTIRRDLPLTQLTDWVNAGNFDVETLETDLDRMIMILQQYNVVLSDANLNITWRGDWATGIGYNLHDLVIAADTNWYYCSEAHTSGTFSTDLAAGKWLLAFNIVTLTDIQTACETAQTGAETAQTAAETAQTAAETAQTGAETAQTGAETAQTAAETAQTGAETAQTGAETAQTGAETAQTGAETAQTAAETAQAEAESSAASINLPPLVAGKAGTIIQQDATDSWSALDPGTEGQVLTSHGADTPLTMEDPTVAPTRTPPTGAELVNASQGGDFSVNTTDTAHDTDLTAWKGFDSTGVLEFEVSARTIQIDAALGTGNGGLSSSLTVAANTTYFLFALSNAGGVTTAFGLDTSATASNLLVDHTTYTKYAYVGHVVTDGSADIIAYKFIKNRIYWSLASTVIVSASFAQMSYTSIDITLFAPASRCVGILPGVSQVATSDILANFSVDGVNAAGSAITNTGQTDATNAWTYSTSFNADRQWIPYSGNFYAKLSGSVAVNILIQAVEIMR